MALKMMADFLYRCLAVSVFTILTFSTVAGQSKSGRISTVVSGNFRLPLNLEVSLSGSYGELRETHFHSGLDFRVGGAVGAMVYAAQDGFISRISISPVGYGNALYIQHPNGRTTLYGHLLEYAPYIARWVKEKQYDNESFAINLSLDSTKFPIKKGDFIGRAGNSGSSGGPHLHFEIRNTATQVPLDPDREANFRILDNLPPQIQRVNFYSISNYTTLPLITLLKSYTEPSANITRLTDTFYVAVAAIDRMNNTNSRLAVANYSFYLDNEKIFTFSPSSIPFDKGGYINSIVEYSEKRQYDRSMVKSWVEPGNALITHIKAKNDGLFILTDNNEHTVMVEVLDNKGNRSTRTYKINRGAGAELQSPTAKQDSLKLDKGKIMPWFITNNFEMGNMKLTLPIGSLYSTILFTADSSAYNGTTLWRLHDENTPIQVHGRLSVKPNIPSELKNKAVIAFVGENGRLGSTGGEWKGDYLESSIGSFGKYLVTVDTLAPKIFPSFKEGENISTRKALKFIIADDLSGIDSYKVTIDNKWILANFDAKTRSLIVALDPEKITKGKTHNLEITVSDNRENINIVKTSFIW